MVAFSDVQSTIKSFWSLNKHCNSTVSTKYSKSSVLFADLTHCASQSIFPSEDLYKQFFENEESKF